MLTISETLNGFLDAFSNLQLNDMLNYFDKDATAFFPIKHEHKRLNGKKEIREVFSRVLGKIKNAGLSQISLVAEDVDLMVFGEVALVTFHIRDDELSRRTLVLEKKNEEWLIVHLHASNSPLKPSMEGAQ
jgi:ketosteroid isomerase-like protein